MPMFCRLLAASLLGWLVGCSASVPPSPASPSQPVPQSYVVSGTVFETVNGISRPVAGRKVDTYINPFPCPPSVRCVDKAEVLETDQNGRYTLAVTVFPKTLVFVTGAGLHALGQQPCLANALVDKDTTIDVQLFPIGSSSTLPPAAGPMITGFVYETTPQGRNPVRGVWAELGVGFGDRYLVARNQTDDAGRFFFCRVNAPVWMGVSSSKDFHQEIPGARDMFFEIELKR